MIRNEGDFFRQVYTPAADGTYPSIEEAVRRVKTMFMPMEGTPTPHVPQRLKESFDDLAANSRQSGCEYDILLRMKQLFMGALGRKESQEGVVQFAKSVERWRFFRYLGRQDKDEIREGRETLEKSWDSFEALLRNVSHLWKRVFGDASELEERDRKTLLSFFLKWGDAPDRLSRNCYQLKDAVEKTEKANKELSEARTQASKKIFVENFRQLRAEGSAIVHALKSLESNGLTAIAPSPDELQKRQDIAKGWLEQIVGKYCTRRLNGPVADADWKQIVFWEGHPCGELVFAEVLKIALTVSKNARTAPATIYKDVCQYLQSQAKERWGTGFSKLEAGVREKVEKVLGDTVAKLLVPG